MGDLIFVVATVAFFAICVLYVNWCDRIIGPDEFGTGSIDDTGNEPGDDAATAPATADTSEVAA